MIRPRPVLVVDDDDDIREVLIIVLESVGYPVVGAADGIEALRWIETYGPPSLVLLDLMMPRMDGEEFMSALRAERRQPVIPVVIMSGREVGPQTAEALRADGCLVKPVDFDELQAIVQRFCGPRADDTSLHDPR